MHKTTECIDVSPARLAARHNIKSEKVSGVDLSVRKRSDYDILQKSRNTGNRQKDSKNRSAEHCLCLPRHAAVAENKHEHTFTLPHTVASTQQPPLTACCLSHAHSTPEDTVKCDENPLRLPKGQRRAGRVTR